MPSEAQPTWLVDPSTFAKTTFDYLVIGGGTAGLALASRLAEDPKYKVGVIDAGAYHHDDPKIDVPVNWAPLLADTSYTWQLATTPQEHAHNRSIYLPSGKVLGGSSAINLMAWMRASKADYDNWAALGNPGWNWEGLLPYLKKAEKYFPQGRDMIFPGVNSSDIEKAKDLEQVYHGSKGPLEVTYNETYDPLIHPTVKSMNALGISTNFTPEFGTATGIFNLPRTVNQPKKTRLYAVNTYLESVGRRGNISVVTEAQATRIVFSKNSGSGLTATGVEFFSKEQSFTAHATKEVILSAGAFQTPQLLELSGIGDAKRLATHEISCLVDLPQVGENYQDHLGVVSSFEVKQDPPKSGFNDAPVAVDPSFTLSTFTFFPLKKIVSDAVLASMVQKLDQEFKSSSPTPLQEAQFKLRRSSIDTNIGTGEILVVGGQPMQGKNYLTMFAATQHPYSRGHVHIESKDPLAKPSVNPHFLESMFDVEVLTGITKFCRTLTETEPLKSILVGPTMPPASIDKDEAYNEFVRESFQTVYHAVGTAAMAPRELGGVVDSSLRVYGTRNLRVVDASIIPLHIATHPQATVYAIAEKAADIIKAER